jgi:PEP-CTERM motif
MSRIIFVLLFVAAIPGMAVGVFNVTTATQVFFDNFENGLAGNSPSVGTWSLIGPDVTDTNALSPGPIEGSFYASLFRDSNTNGQGNLQAALSAVQSTNGDLIELSFMLYLPSVSDGEARAQLILDNGNFNSARAWAIPCGPVTIGNCTAGHVGAGTNAGFVDTGLVYATNTWQEWDLFYVVGASTFSISVNGVSASGFGSFTSGSVGFADLFNGVSASGGTIFLDAVPQVVSGVPEPASMMLVMGGLAAITAIAKRRNRR